jgi:O-acetyl-ADP-ribose deacetylase (regulator of RNase III)
VKSNQVQSYLDGRVVVVVGDITREDVDAIVNAANSTLLGGGGVDGAIHDGGGPEILKECQEIRRTQYPRGLPTGKAVITTGGNLPARYVIHTVGPIYGRELPYGSGPGLQGRLLADCYRNSLTLAREHSLTSIAFPSISTGAFGYPKIEAAAVSSRAIKEFVQEDKSIEQVRLVFFLERDARVFRQYQEFE